MPNDTQEYVLTPRGGARGLTIVLDRTSSMQDVIDLCKETLAAHIIRRVAAGDELEELALVTFDDHYPGDGHDAYAREIRAMKPGTRLRVTANPITAYGVTDNLEEFMYWLHTVPLGHGADGPEAIACALETARKLPVSVPHSIWLITDAIPHGAPTSNRKDSPSYDNFPDGCPCGVPWRVDDTHVLMVGHDWLIEEYGRHALGYGNALSVHNAQDWDGDLLREALDTPATLPDRAHEPVVTRSSGSVDISS